MSAKPLAKALHTVTVVARVAATIPSDQAPDEVSRTLAALAVLGYTEAQARASGDLFAACVAAVVKLAPAPSLGLSGAQRADEDRAAAGRRLALVG